MSLSDEAALIAEAMQYVRDMIEDDGGECRATAMMRELCEQIQSLRALVRLYVDSANVRPEHEALVHAKLAEHPGGQT